MVNVKIPPTARTRHYVEQLADYGESARRSDQSVELSGSKSQAVIGGSSEKESA